MLARWKAKAAWFYAPSLLGILFLSANPTSAERLPLRTYTTADGLVSNRISRIVRDSRGYLWFCTEDGLSRFDGHSFTNYTIEQGLPNNDVNDLLETRNGGYWVATANGLCRFDPGGTPLARGVPSKPLFTIYRPDEGGRSMPIKALYEDSSGSIWVGTWQGLYRLELIDNQVKLNPVNLGRRDSERDTLVVRNILEDRHRTLWLATNSGLYRYFPDGRVDRFTRRHGLSGDTLMGLIEDRSGRIWVGDRTNGLCQLVADPDVDHPLVARRYSFSDGLDCVQITSLLETSDGKLWIGTDCGVSELLPETGPRFNRITTYIRGQDMSDPRVWSLAEDARGNLWIGSAGGAIHVARSEFTTYTPADGLGAPEVVNIVESRSGELCVQTRSRQQSFLSKFDGQGFIAVNPKLPQPDSNYDVLSSQDSEGNWWVGTTHGCWRFPVTKRVEELGYRRPERFYGTTESTSYEDRRGDVWISPGVQGGIIRWERRSATFHTYSEREGLPAVADRATTYAEDRAGNLWIGFKAAGLARYSNGRFRFFNTADGIPQGIIMRLLVDVEGRLWIASDGGGLARIDEPTAEVPRVFTYTTTEGLSNNGVSCIVEDKSGRFYIGTHNGLDRLDPATGRIKHFTTSDGLANNFLLVSFRDRYGDLWFGTDTGLSKLSSEPDHPQPLPPVFISRLQIPGGDYRVSELGEAAVRGLELGPSQNNIQIEFVSLEFGAEATLRYQYKLEGADAEWNAPTDHRSVNFASLGPGAYRFLVRAVNTEGEFSLDPASVEFTILRPIWQRWWFISAASLLIGTAIYSMYRYRLKQKLEVERVRTRIAADLHDDIGANLTRIAILSEVAHSRLGDGNTGINQPLSSIAQISRESVASMSDIVWAINPKRDSLLDLIQRMRRFAGEIFAARKIEFEFRAPETEQDLKLGANVRRDLFLIFKEALNNAARHSDCDRVDIDLSLDRSSLLLKVSDNGRGFDVSEPREGEGLVSMRRRAVGLGGELGVRSLAGEGTEIMLKIPRRTR